MVGDYRTGHNAAMPRRFVLRLLIACLAFLPPPVFAWNAAGHRLVAAIAWQRMSVSAQAFVADALAAHPDYGRWRDKAKGDAAAVFAEAATWPDDIRDDPRFYDDTRETPTPPFPGMPDTARHKPWHYVDLDARGRVVHGELDRQVERLGSLLRSTGKKAEIAYALPWLAHLIADIHQPLHVGRDGDEGGNAVEIENPFNKRLPFTRLHTYWDDLPGPPWLRGKRLEERATRLIERHPAPDQGNVRQWRDESHRLLADAYPTSNGTLLPTVNEEFQQKTRAIADRRIVEAGFRLGLLLNEIAATRVSRETK